MPGFVPWPSWVEHSLHTLPHGESLDAAGDAAPCSSCMIRLRILVKNQKDNGHGRAPSGVLAELNLGKYFLASSVSAAG